MTPRDPTPGPPGLHEAEQAVLGAAMAETAAAQAAAGAGLVAADFTDPAHRAIWAAVAAGLTASGGTDALDVFKRLQAAGQAEHCGGLQHINSLANGAEAGLMFGRPDRVQHHAQRIRQAAHARRLLGLAEDLAAGRVTADAVARAQSELAALQPTAAGSTGFVLRLQDGQADEPAPWQVVPVVDLDTAQLEPQGWLWGRYLPTREVTLLGAHGGTGKSWLSLMMAVSVAAGIPLFGQPTTAAPVVVFSAEDDGATLRRRLRIVCAALAVPAESLADSLLILDASDGNALLFEAMPAQGGPVPMPHATPAFLALQRVVLARPGALVIVDNASETFAGNENARQDVRAFVRQLRALARMVDAAVLLLAHVDKASAKGLGAGQAYSGSTAWHNSARSRLALSRDKDGFLLLEHDKSTHAMPHAPLRLQWVENGLPEPVEADSPLTARLTAEARTVALLRLVHEFAARGESVRTSESGPATAPKLLQGEPGYPADLKDSDALRLLREAERSGLLERQQYRDHRRHPQERWLLTAAGVALLGDGARVARVARVAEFSGTGAPTQGARVCAQGGVGGLAHAQPTRAPADSARVSTRAPDREAF